MSSLPYRDHLGYRINLSEFPVQFAAAVRLIPTVLAEVSSNITLHKGEHDPVLITLTFTAIIIDQIQSTKTSDITRNAICPLNLIPGRGAICVPIVDQLEEILKQVLNGRHRIILKAHSPPPEEGPES